jgi:hypothetical protein
MKKGTLITDFDPALPRVPDVYNGHCVESTWILDGIPTLWHQRGVQFLSFAATAEEVPLGRVRRVHPSDAHKWESFQELDWKDCPRYPQGGFEDGVLCCETGYGRIPTFYDARVDVSDDWEVPGRHFFGSRIMDGTLVDDDNYTPEEEKSVRRELMKYKGLWRLLGSTNDEETSVLRDVVDIFVDGDRPTVAADGKKLMGRALARALQRKVDRQRQSPMVEWALNESKENPL